MALFVGRHRNKVDRKGRVSVPKPFRAAFDGQDFAGVYVYPLFKFNALEACGADFMQRIADSLDDLPMFSDEQDDLSVVLENAAALAFDPEGRIVLPQEFREMAGIGDEAEFVGRGQRFQVWDPETYAEVRSPAFERARTRGATLALRPRAGDGEVRS